MGVWGRREQKQIEAGNADQGEPAGATTANNDMDNFIALMVNIVHANGLGHARIHQKREKRDVLALTGVL